MEIAVFRMLCIHLHEYRLADTRMDVLSIILLPFFKFAEFQIVFRTENAQQHAVGLVLPPEIVVTVHDLPQIRMMQNQCLNRVAENIVANDDIARRRRHLIGEQMA